MVRIINQLLKGGRAAQILSGAGAIDLTRYTTRLTSTGAAQAVTIADANLIGQRKRIMHSVDGGSMVITASSTVHLADSLSTITFTAVRDWVELEWTGTAWAVIGYAGATFA